MREFSFKSPVNYSSLVHFRKRIEPITLQINEILLKSFGVLNCDKEELKKKLSNANPNTDGTSNFLKIMEKIFEDKNH